MHNNNTRPFDKLRERTRKIEGNIVNLFDRKIFKGEVIIEGDRITKINPKETTSDVYILPGLIDSHIHIESTMMIPSEFAKVAVKNGTVGVVTDPHEIANVLGEKGIDFMIKNSESTPLKTFYCVPSCVPATTFETSGATLNADKIDKIFTKYNLKVLGEMMNYPGVIFNDQEVLAKIEIAKKHGAVIDGHAPHVTGDNLKKYIASGITTDHECGDIEEAIEKIKLGMNILIREGSAAKNFEALYPLISKFNKMVMLSTDDSHPDDLTKFGHINKILKMGIKNGIDIFDLLNAACVNPVKHYNLPIGLLRENDYADMIIVDDLKKFNILETIINGNTVYSDGRILFSTKQIKPINNFEAKRISESDLHIEPKSKKIKVIEIIENELLTNCIIEKAKIENNNVVSDIDNDILKIVVMSRYTKDAKPQIGFIRGFGLRVGAIATSVAHDSHNIIAVGTSDEDIMKAINEIVDNKGGLCYVKGTDYYTLPLEFAGLMTQQSCERIGEIYGRLNHIVKSNGCRLQSPFMTLSFMALLVIPSLKLSDKGLFDGDKFEMTDLFV